MVGRPQDGPTQNLPGTKFVVPSLYRNATVIKGRCCKSDKKYHKPFIRTRYFVTFQWHSLDRSEQAKYYEMARKEKELHLQLHPGWSARDNYATKNKKKKVKKDGPPGMDVDKGIRTEDRYPDNPAFGKNLFVVVWHAW